MCDKKYIIEVCASSESALNHCITKNINYKSKDFMKICTGVSALVDACACARACVYMSVHVCVCVVRLE